MAKRLIVWGIALTGTLGLTGVLALGVFLSAWVPTQGKELLEQELERHWPVEVSIGSMRYRPVQGLRLEDVTILQDGTQTPWLVAPRLTVQVGWWSLILRNAVFRADASLETPARTELTVSGRYRLREQVLQCRLRTADTALETLSGTLSDHLPSSLDGGVVRLDAQLRWRPETPWRITGQLIGARLLWRDPPLQALGDVMLEGTVEGPARAGVPAPFDVVTTVRQGAIEGLPTLDRVTELEGTGRLTPEGLEIKQLRGKVRGAVWHLEGTIAPLSKPTLEILIRSQLELQAFADLLPRSDGWEVSGPVDLRGVCRGPLSPEPTMDCLALADLRGASLTNAAAPEPITHIVGRIGYDLLARRVTIEQLTLRLRKEELAVRGTVTLTEPAQLDLATTGELDLGGWTGWFPTPPALQAIEGHASVDVTVQGLMPSPTVNGQMALREGRARLTGVDHPLEAITGTVELSGERVTLRETSLQFAAQPLTLSGTITDVRTTPRFKATLGFPNGTLQGSGVWDRDHVVIEMSELTTGASRLHLSGDVARDARQPSHLTLKGLFEPADLTRLPLIKPTALDLSKIQGQVAVDVRFDGSLKDVKSATLAGEIGADTLRVWEVPLEKVRLELAQAQRTLRLRIQNARLAEGTLWSHTVIEHRPGETTFVWQVDAANVQLAQLARAIPYWRDRAITGTASTNARMSGTLEQRATWIGEGWLKASGRQLGDVPLLDQLLQRLFGALGNRLGLEELRRAEITDVSLQWRLAREQFGTDDLRLGGLVAGTEPIAIYARGSIGLDRTLDLVIEPEFSEGIVLEAPTTSTVARTVLKAAGQFERFRQLIGRHRLTGTIQNPQFRFELTIQETLKQLAPGPADLLEGILKSLR